MKYAKNSMSIEKAKTFIGKLCGSTIFGKQIYQECVIEDILAWAIFWTIAFVAIFIGHIIMNILIKEGFIEIDAGVVKEDDKD